MTHHYALVTGANSGLGFAICCRLIDEAHPSYEALTLIFTTRSVQKGAETLERLKNHYNSREKSGRAFVTFQPEIVDLLKLRTVQELSSRILKSTPRLDSIFLNAGFGAFTEMDWPRATWATATDFMANVTWPLYPKSLIGGLAPKQTKSTEPPLGEVFCANVFGHYLLVQQLLPLLQKSDAAGRVIWISSIEALGRTFDSSDLQSLRSQEPYRGSKRLTDLLALTAHLPGSKPFIESYLAGYPASQEQKDDTRTAPIRMYTCHPGICSTEIVPLGIIPKLAKIMAFYMAGWMGSPWHTLTAYKGACAPVWIALSPQQRLDDLEKVEGVSKWGSARNFWGDEHVVRTEVDEYGYGGRVGERTSGRKGRHRDAQDATAESLERFEELGRDCWKQMEDLRGEWEDILEMGGADQ